MLISCIKGQSVTVTAYSDLDPVSTKDKARGEKSHASLIELCTCGYPKNSLNHSFAPIRAR